ncbi:MAG: hypothetical protein R3D56_00725 [Paracoccaceae bacterium]
MLSDPAVLDLVRSVYAWMGLMGTNRLVQRLLTSIYNGLVPDD